MSYIRQSCCDLWLTFDGQGVARTLPPTYAPCPMQDAALSSANVTFLIRNYRSHPDIIDLPNKLFYNGRLLACADPVVSNK